MFIPATPSGYTPAADKHVQMGNYFEATGEKPPRRPSIVKRALNRRRNSLEYPPSASKAPGFLTRTFSLSRNVRKAPGGVGRPSLNPDMEGRATYPQAEDAPAEEDKLHPFWRPQWDDNYSDDYGSEDDHDERVYRYPPIDNRPSMPKRSLSERMKRTFAVFPVQDNQYYYVDDSRGPERRTIRRTPSGNLRVMRRRSSAESIEQMHEQARPSTAPEGPKWKDFGVDTVTHRYRAKTGGEGHQLGARLRKYKTSREG